MFGKKTSKTPAGEPRFCRTCQFSTPETLERNLCPECGDTLIPQGFCPVCERHWSLPVGAPCPKHEIALKSRLQSAAPPARSGKPVSWVTVWKFPDTLAAAVPRIRLEAEGIPTFLEGERMAGLGVSAVAPGGVKLQVPEELVSEARIILSQRWGPKSDKDRIEEL